MCVTKGDGGEHRGHEQLSVWLQLGISEREMHSLCLRELKLHSLDLREIKIYQFCLIDTERCIYSSLERQKHSLCLRELKLHSLSLGEVRDRNITLALAQRDIQKIQLLDLKGRDRRYIERRYIYLALVIEEDTFPWYQRHERYIHFTFKR